MFYTTMLCTYFILLIQDSHPQLKYRWRVLHAPCLSHPSRDTPQSPTTITTPPPQAQRGESNPKDPSTLPSGEHRGRLQRNKTLHPRGSGDDLHGMHVAHAVVGPIINTIFWMRGAEGGRSADWSNRVGSSGAEGGMQARSRTPPWWRRGRGRAWTVDYARGWSVNLGGTLLSPWRLSLLVFPTKAGSRWYCFLVGSGRYVVRHPGTAVLYSKSL